MTDNGTTIPDGGPAFPQPVEIAGRGMSLRDYFAAAALTGIMVQWAILARQGGFTLKKEPFIELDEEILAERCYKHADAMLAERAK